MDEKCMAEQGQQACIPFFVHENSMMHYNRANKRMLIALIVCLSIMTIIVVTLGYMFLTSYNEREKGWQQIVNQRITEVADEGIHEQPDP